MFEIVEDVSKDENNLNVLDELEVQETFTIKNCSKIKYKKIKQAIKDIKSKEKKFHFYTERGEKNNINLLIVTRIK